MKRIVQMAIGKNDGTWKQLEIEIPIKTSKHKRLQIAQEQINEPSVFVVLIDSFCITNDGNVTR